MSYNLCFSLPTQSPRHLKFGVEALVRALVAMDMLHLLEHPYTPPLYESGVVYVPDEQTGAEIQWWTIPTILQEGYADCKGLAAWRIAELAMMGVPAEALVTQHSSGSHVLQHVRVQTADGVEDPSRILGM